jgi:hypothetical protein
MMVSKPIILFGQKFFIIGTLKEEVYLALGGKLGNPTSMGGTALLPQDRVYSNLEGIEGAREGPPKPLNC